MDRPARPTKGGITRVKERKNEIAPVRLAAIAPRNKEAFMISWPAVSDDSDPIRLRAGKSRAELAEGGLIASLPRPEFVRDPSRKCRPLVPVEEELLARLADPLSIRGRGPPGAPPLDGRPIPILSADGELVKELARFDNFSVRPATGEVDVVE